MFISDELRLARFRRLHAKFLDASEEFPGLYHSACRSDQERLWIIMSPGWVHEVVPEEHKKPHKDFWEEALCYGRYARLPVENSRFRRPCRLWCLQFHVCEVCE